MDNDTHRFEKFTREAKQALIVAQEKAKASGLDYVGTEHVLIGVLSQSNSLGAHILQNFGVSTENVELVLKTVGRLNTQGNKAKKSDDKTGLSGFAKKVIEQAVKAGEKYNHSYIGTEHLLYALVSQENTAATVILENMKINASDVKDQIDQTFEKGKEMQAKGVPLPPSQPGAAGGAAGQGQVNPMEFFLNGLQGALVGQVDKEEYKKKKKKDGKKTKTPALDYFTTDMIEQAAKGQMDPVIGREKEIERMVSILCRKTKNNPVIIGEPGVGKTALAEGLAQAIHKDNVPDQLLNKKILALSMTSVIAGTKYRGEFEERVKQILDELKTVKNAILFIDEVHTVVGAGSAEGSLDAANILKPALSRGAIQVIGATTTSEYRKQIESDAALERRFQPIMVNEPSQEESRLMLEGLRESFEDHHNLQFTTEALDSAITLSSRYINDRYLPDKAIDLIDEAASLKRVNTRSGSDANKKLQKDLSAIIKKKEDAVSRQDYEKAADLRNKELELIKLIEEAKIVKTPRGKRKKVTEEDIAKVISSMTGIPVTKLVKSEMQNLIKLGNKIKQRVIGQDEAVEAVAKSIRRSRAGFSDENRPIGSFIFMGPTGVGKTELVRVLAQEIYDDKDALIKIDMSEFMEKHTTSRLIGTTAGYVGYDDGGQLTELVRRKPYSIVLFDEIEKAHPEVFNLLLQILEDGVLTDSKGRKIDFKNTIVILTSNIGASKLTEKAAPIGFSSAGNELEEAEAEFENTKKDILADLKEHFKPEFLNRIDKTIVFRALTQKSIKEIVKLHLDMLQLRLNPKNITIKTTNSGLDYLAQKGYDPKYGARPVRRAIQDYVEDPLTNQFLEGEFKEGDTISINKNGDKLELTKVKKTAKK